MTPGSRRTAGRIVLLVLALAVILAVHVFYTRHAVGGRISKTLWGMNLLHYSKFVAELPKKTQRGVEDELLAAASEIRATAPRLSPETGLYDRAVVVEVHGASQGAELRYTTDGSVPTRNNPRFTGELPVTESAVVRVKAFEPGRLPSETVTATYIIGHSGDLPVASLVLDPVYLHDKHAGIYANPRRKGRAWERPVTFAILSPVSGGVLQAAGRLRIHGNASRGGFRKSLRLYLDQEDGDLRAWFGPQADLISESQSEWVLRHAPNYRQIYRDRLATRLAHQLGLPASPMVPVVVYVNGEVWGIYDIMERINSAFVVGKSPGDDPTLLRGSLRKPREASGDRDSWLALRDFVMSSDLALPELYREVERAIDLDNLIDYWVLFMFTAENDRPAWNMDIYRASDDDPWRFLVWDFDGSFNYLGRYMEHDTVAWNLRDHARQDLKLSGSPDSEGAARSTFLFRKLMTNDGFRRRFSARAEVLLNTTLSSENLVATFEDMLATYGQAWEMELRGRFPDDPPDVAAARIEEQIALIRVFLERRPDVVRELLRRHVSS